MIRELAAQLYDEYWEGGDFQVPFNEAPDYVQEKWLAIATTAVKFCLNPPNNDDDPGQGRIGAQGMG